MRQYIVRRLLIIIPTLIGITILVFSLVRLLPGDVISLMLQEGGYESLDEAGYQRLRARLGLDVPIHIQYVRWVSGIVLRGDVGNSLYHRVPVASELIRRLPVTLELSFFSMLFALIIGVPVGIFAAIRQDTILDYLLRSAIIALLATPYFWLAVLVIVFASIYLNWSPPTLYVDFFEDPARNVLQFLIPGAILGSHIGARVMRMTRTMMLEVMRQDYIRTAWAKGLKEGTVIWRHAIKNAMIPVITIIGIQLVYTLGGSVIFEQIFMLPGIGRFMYDGVLHRDYPVIQGVNLIFAIMVVFLNLVVDIGYAWLDPRVRFR